MQWREVAADYNMTTSDPTINGDAGRKYASQGESGELHEMVVSEVVGLLYGVGESRVMIVACCCVRMGQGAPLAPGMMLRQRAIA